MSQRVIPDHGTGADSPGCLSVRHCGDKVPPFGRDVWPEGETVEAQNEVERPIEDRSTVDLSPSGMRPPNNGHTTTTATTPSHVATGRKSADMRSLLSVDSRPSPPSKPRSAVLRSWSPVDRRAAGTLTPGPFLTYIHLSRLAGTEGTRADWLTIENPGPLLAECRTMSRQAIYRHLADIEASGLASINRTGRRIDSITLTFGAAGFLKLPLLDIEAHGYAGTVAVTALAHILPTDELTEWSSRSGAVSNAVLARRTGASVASLRRGLAIAAELGTIETQSEPGFEQWHRIRYAPLVRPFNAVAALSTDTTEERRGMADNEAARAALSDPSIPKTPERPACRQTRAVNGEVNAVVNTESTHIETENCRVDLSNPPKQPRCEPGNDQGIDSTNTKRATAAIAAAVSILSSARPDLTARLGQVKPGSVAARLRPDRAKAVGDLGGRELAFVLSEQAEQQPWPIIVESPSGLLASRITALAANQLETVEQRNQRIRATMDAAEREWQERTQAERATPAIVHLRARLQTEARQKAPVELRPPSVQDPGLADRIARITERVRASQ